MRYYNDNNRCVVVRTPPLGTPPLVRGVDNGSPDLFAQHTVDVIARAPSTIPIRGAEFNLTTRTRKERNGGKPCGCADTPVDREECF